MNVKNLMEKRLKKRYLDAWLMYHMIVEHHWKPSEILSMKPWELGCVSAIAERYAIEVDRIRNKK